MSTVLPVLIMVLFLILGLPVGFSLGFAGLLGLYLVGGFDAIASIMSTTPFGSIASFTLIAAPMFIFMAHIIAESKIVGELFDAAVTWVGKMPGGLAIATVIASACMGAMSGSSTAAAATVATIAVPEMKRNGYKTEVAAGVVTVAGTLAIMIPPSIPLVIYGLTTETNIGKLLIAGIIPGLITALVYITGITIWNKTDPTAMPVGKSYTFKEKMTALKPLGPFLLILLLVIGSLYSGIATATEAAAMGALGSIFVALGYRRLSWEGFNAALKNTAHTTAFINTIIIGAMIFGYFLTLTQAPQHAVAAVVASGIPKLVVVCILVVIYLILGCFLEVISILMLTLPLAFPLMMGFGYDAIWFGIIVVKLCEIGLITPPVGMNAYVVSAVTKTPLATVFRGTGRMLLMEACTLIILLAFPILATWLPSIMM